jgi:hypothetical protein
MTPEKQGPWELFAGGEVGAVDCYATHAEAIAEASHRVCARYYLGLPPRTYGVYKRRDT